MTLEMMRKRRAWKEEREKLAPGKEELDRQKNPQLDPDVLERQEIVVNVQ